MLRRPWIPFFVLLPLAVLSAPFAFWGYIQQDGRTLSGLRVAAEPVEPTLDPAAALQPRADAWLDTAVTVEAHGQRLHVTRRELGARIDVARVAAGLRAIGHRGDPIGDLREYYVASRGLIDRPWPVRIDRPTVAAFVERVRASVDREPRAARFDLAARVAEHEQVGYALRVDAAVAVIRQTITEGALLAELPLTEFQPPPGDRLPEGLSLAAVVGSFETRFRSNGTARSRAHNVQLAAGRLDGAIIPAHEVFSFNERVGERSTDAGYRLAHVIFDGEMIDGVGGGTCQVASTLHAASFFAGLEMLDHTPHSRPSAYIPMGLDATVVWPRVDLRIRNPYDFPVIIHAVAERGRMRVEILGARRPRRVGFERTIVARTDFDEREIVETTLPVGTRVVTQEGVNGYTIVRVRVIQSEGEAFNEERMITYPPTDRVVHVGSGPAVPPGTDISAQLARIRAADPVPHIGETSTSPREVIAIAQ